MGYFVGAELEYNVDIGVILEVSPKLDDVPMLQALMNFYFAH